MFSVGEYKFVFEHEKEEWGISLTRFGKDRLIETPYKGITTCRVLKNDKVVSEGFAYLSVSEKTFDKSVGRKISLTRAIKGFDKSFRVDVWKEYFRVSNKVK